MPLTLVTGPANAAKAGVVFERLRAARGGDPLLVVPTAADAAHYRRELAESGLVLGPEVATFEGLIRDVARAAGVPGRPIGRLARERVIAAVVRGARLQRLAASAAAPGFVAAAAALFADLRQARATPDRFAAALRSWADGDGDRTAYGRELAGLYRAYDVRLTSLGRPDAEQHGWTVLTALRERPPLWGERTVALYGWDDLTPLQVDAVETLAGPVGASVIVSLAFEPGRSAFAARAGLVERLREQAAEHIELEPSDAYYEPASRAALAHLERSLFQDGARRVDPDGAVRLLEAGGERAEAELAGAEIQRLLAAGVAPSSIAVVLRAGEGERAAFCDVLCGLDVPVAAGGTVALEATSLGAGLLALARAALPRGSAGDLLRWLRTPGRLPTPEPADELERRIRRGELQTAAAARRVWEAALGQPPLAELDRIAAAARAYRVRDADPDRALPANGAAPPRPLSGPAGLLAALEAELGTTWTAPHHRRGEVLDSHGHADARLAAGVGRAFADLRELARTDPAALGELPELLAAVAALRVPAQTPGSEDGVLVADPLAIRARRFRIVLVCGLQEGSFPRPPLPDPFLDDVDRRELARASGLVLPAREAGIDQERFLFYSCASRPTERLVLSFRSCGEEGEPLQPSPFVDDVRELFSDELWRRRGRRLLADVAFPPAAAPTPRELERALAAAGAPAAGPPTPLPPPSSHAVLALLAARTQESARGLEAFAGCPVRWLVEQLLSPVPVDPDAEALRRGALAHRVLERTLALLRERTGSARLAPERLPAAREALATALQELPAARGGVGARVMLRRLEAGIDALLAHEARTGPGLEPAELEWSFGSGKEGAAPALELAGVNVSGRVDRIDVDPGSGEAIVRDYKGYTVYRGAIWEQERRLQVQLYLLAVERLLGLRPLAGVYQPVGAKDPRARGLVRDRADTRRLAPSHYVSKDLVDDKTFAAALVAAQQEAERVAADLHAGRIAARPDTCGPNGCQYPGICRGAEQ